MNTDKKMRFETADLVEENINKLAGLFPSVITEDIGENGRPKKSVNFELLRQLLSDDVLDGNEAYEFTWVGKKAAVVEANRPVRKTLRPCVEESRDWDNTENLYIEGDNLDALKLLRESYLGKIKMIYIDPPYNTGSDRFVYPDDYKMDREEYEEKSGMYDEDGKKLFAENSRTDPRYHSVWCSIMYSRLLAARDLLCDEGVILINIDENETVNLQKLCEEVFGEANNVGTIVWDKRNPKGDSKGIACQHENILVYAANKSRLIAKNDIKRPKKNAERMLAKAKQLFKRRSKSFTLEDINREFSEWIKDQENLSGGERAYNKIDENGDVYRPVSMAWPNNKKAPDDYFAPLIHPVTGKPCPVPKKGWRNPSGTMKTLLEQGRILFGKDETVIPNSKYLLKENLSENIPSLLYYGGSDADMLAEMGIVFETSKVVEIVKEHIDSFTKPGDIILDFFSGSATTAHAVMRLNAEDGGHRKFIMVQYPGIIKENSAEYETGCKTICELGRKRIRRAAEKIAAEAPQAVFDGGFRVLRIDESNMTGVYYSAEEFDRSVLDSLESNIKPDRSALDLLFGCLTEWGILLSKPYFSEKTGEFTVHDYDNGSLIACFDNNISEDVIKNIAKRKPRRAVFRDSGFADSPAKLNVFEIFRQYSPDTIVRII